MGRILDEQVRQPAHNVRACSAVHRAAPRRDIELEAAAASTADGAKVISQFPADQLCGRHPVLNRFPAGLLTAG
jgi:hypothetical protein